MEATEPKKQDLPYFHKRILEIIQEGHNVTRSYIVEKLALKEKDKRKINQIIHDLIFEYGYAIGSSHEPNGGYFMIEDESDLKVACHTLNIRAMKNLERHKKIIENYNNRNK